MPWPCGDCASTLSGAATRPRSLMGLTMFHMRAEPAADAREPCAGCRVVHRHERLGARKRQGLEQHAVHHAENGGVRSHLRIECEIRGLQSIPHLPLRRQPLRRRGSSGCSGTGGSGATRRRWHRRLGRARRRRRGCSESRSSRRARLPGQARRGSSCVRYGRDGLRRAVERKVAGVTGAFVAGSWVILFGRSRSDGRALRSGLTDGPIKRPSRPA
jgi:hypothetical protein